jgi:hypothetical protein
VDVTITVGGETTAEELYSLRRWLIGEDELRGEVRVVERPPDPGKLGSLPDALVIALGPGGVGAVLASAVIAWIRHRTGDVSLEMTCPDGSSVQVQGRRLRGLTADDVSAQVERLGRVCGQQPGQTPNPAGGAEAVEG